MECKHQAAYNKTVKKVTTIESSAILNRDRHLLYLIEISKSSLVKLISNFRNNQNYNIIIVFVVSLSRTDLHPAVNVDNIILTEQDFEHFQT